MNEFFPCERKKMGKGTRAMTIITGVVMDVAGGTLRRIPEHLANLRIPPAWTNVTVCLDPDAKCYAMGNDIKGRQCRLYSSHHTKTASTAKFDKVAKLLKVAHKIQSKLEKDTRKAKCTDTQVVAYLIFEMGLRPGSNTDTLADKKAYGATTLLAKHVKVMASGTVYLKFTGKKGVAISQKVRNPWLADMLRYKKAKTEGRYTTPLFDTNPGKLNAYVKTLNPGLNPKDLRTLKATVIATEFMEGKRIPKVKSKAKLMLKKLFTAVSAILGNTNAVVKKSYVSPEIYQPLTDVIGIKP